MSFRNIGMQIQALPIKNYCYSTRCCDYLNAPEMKPNWSYGKYKKHLKNKQINFCEQLSYQMCKASTKSCCLIEDRATAWYRRQKEIRAMIMTHREAKVENNFHPNLDLKTPIRKVAPVAKEMKNVSYISPEFQELLRKHDKLLREKYKLNYLPENYTRRRLRAEKDKLKDSSDKLDKHVCTCESMKQELTRKPDIKVKASLKNYLNCFTCCNKQADSDEDLNQCNCLTDLKPGEFAKCEICLQRLKRKSNKYLAKNPRFWVGTRSQVNRQKRETGGTSHTSIASKHYTLTFNNLSHNLDPNTKPKTSKIAQTISEKSKPKFSESEITLTGPEYDKKSQFSKSELTEKKIEAKIKKLEKKNSKKPSFKIALKKLFRKHKNIEKRSSQAIKTSRNSVAFISE